MSNKLTIKKRFLGKDYLEDEDGNKFELIKPLIGDPYYLIDGNKYYPEEDGEKLEERKFFKRGDYFEKQGGIFHDHYVKRGSCLITLTCVMVMGLSDNCEELTILRKFRRDHLVGTPTGNTILQEYKETSSKIIDWVEIKDNRANLYSDLFQRLVRGSIHLIKSGKTDDAINNYLTIVKEYENMAS